jgi:tetratricopeptide (TPR) repeat protein
MKFTLTFFAIPLALCLATATLPASMSPAQAEELLKQAKLAMFDENWSEALSHLNRLEDVYPSSEVFGQSTFYRARVLEKMGQRVSALHTLERFLELSGQPEALVSEARFSLVRLSVELSRRGNQAFLDRIRDGLGSSEPELQFYTAVQISFMSQEKLRKLAIPVLQQMRRQSNDAEIRNQATLALLRIDPKLLESDRSPPQGKRSLKVSIVEDGDEVFRISLPFSLARMLFSALPEDVKNRLLEEGINPENLLRQLETAGTVLEFKSEYEWVKIWIE